MAPGGDTPDWLKIKRESIVSESRRLDRERIPLLNIFRSVLVGIVFVLSAASLYLSLDSPEMAAAGVFSTGVAILVLVVITERPYTLPYRLAYLSVALAVNVLFTVYTSEEDVSVGFSSLASIVLISGAIGLAILDSDSRGMPRRLRVVVFAFVLLLFVISNLHFTVSPDEDLGYLLIWLRAAYIPLAILLVFAAVYVAMYPRNAQTMPADKWV